MCIFLPPPQGSRWVRHVVSYTFFCFTILTHFFKKGNWFGSWILLIFVHVRFEFVNKKSCATKRIYVKIMTSSLRDTKPSDVSANNFLWCNPLFLIHISMYNANNHKMNHFLWGGALKMILFCFFFDYILAGLKSPGTFLLIDRESNSSPHPFGVKKLGNFYYKHFKLPPISWFFLSF